MYYEKEDIHSKLVKEYRSSNGGRHSEKLPLVCINLLYLIAES